MFFLLVVIFGFFAFSCVSSQCFSWNLHFGLFAFFLIFLWETCHWICLRFSCRCLCHLSLVRALTWVTGEAPLSTLSRGGDCGLMPIAFCWPSMDCETLGHSDALTRKQDWLAQRRLRPRLLHLSPCSGAPWPPSLSFGMDRKICRKVMDYVSFFSFLSFSHRVSFTLTDLLVPSWRTLRGSHL